MKEFFGEDYLLQGASAKKIYSAIKDLPIIDYHCHLDDKAIKEDKTFSDIGELWLSGDHYKWRAMRLCGVSEDYITGYKSINDKFCKLAEIMPNLCGNPVYAWAHMELKQIFGIEKPLNSDTAEEIWNEANEKLKTLSVRKLLKKFNVEYIATTDDPFSALDRKAEDAIFACLQEYAKDKVVFLISHRLYHFPQMQQVLFMDGGKTTVGTHEELLSAVPVYRQLFESQTGGKTHEEAEK